MHATYHSASDLPAALRLAAAAHGVARRHEPEIAHATPSYAKYRVDEQAGRPGPAVPGASP
jgi:sirohydrochlorin ferrochelatase